MTEYDCMIMITTQCPSPAPVLGAAPRYMPIAGSPGGPQHVSGWQHMLQALAAEGQRQALAAAGGDERPLPDALELKDSVIARLRQMQ